MTPAAPLGGAFTFQSRVFQDCLCLPDGAGLFGRHAIVGASATNRDARAPGLKRFSLLHAQFVILLLNLRITCPL